jgi:hypothetical protein
LEIARERFEAVRETGAGNVRVTYLTDIGSLPGCIDVAILATTSDVRRELIVSLTESKNVSYFVLEKILFNRVEDYAYIQNLLEAKGIKAWVNCSRRTFDCYRQLKTLLRHEPSVVLTVEGKNWGLGCNAIHFIDLLAFLSNGTELRLDLSQLDEEILPSKRAGFIEFTGTLSGSLDESHTFRLTSRVGTVTESLLQITSSNYKITVAEGKGEMLVKRRSTGWQEEVFHISIPVQSRSTNKVVEEILLTGESSLSSYEESMRLHIPLIEGFLSKLNQGELKTDICNVT